jgi:helix-turn-helix, Psq domain
MRVKHTRRTAIVVLCLLKLDAFVKSGNVNTLRMQRLVWARTQLRRLEVLPRAAREQLALVAVLIGLRLLALAEFIVQEKHNAVSQESDEPVFRRIIETVETTAWPSPDLPIGEPTPVLLFGHDENGKGEIIDMTPADLPIPSTLVENANRIENREAKLSKAIDMVQGGTPIRKAANAIGVAESTLRNRIKKLTVQMVEAAGHA